MRKTKISVFFISAVLAIGIIAERIPSGNVLASGKIPVSGYLPILMYHQISADTSKLSTFVISKEEFEEDLQTLQQNGYSTITIKDLIDYTQKGVPLPEKPIMLTFDDGYESDFVYAFPLLKQYKQKAVFSIIGKYADLYTSAVNKDIRYSHLSWPQIKEMHDSGLAEFHNHTYDMHNTQKRRGALKEKNESLLDYENAITKDFKILNDKYTDYVGEVPSAFACPYGYYNSSLKEVVKKLGFSAILTSHQRVNLLTGDPEELYYLGRYVRAHGTSLQSLIKTWEEDTKTVEK